MSQSRKPPSIRRAERDRREREQAEQLRMARQAAQQAADESRALHDGLMAMARAKQECVCMVLMPGRGAPVRTCGAPVVVTQKGIGFCAGHAHAYGVEVPVMSEGRRRARERQGEINGSDL